MMILPIRKKSICAGGLNKGYSIKYNYKSTVYHVAEPHYSRVIEENIFKLQKFIINVNQNVPKDNLYRILFSRMILDGIAGIQFLFGNFLIFQQFLKHTILFTSFSTTYKKAIFRK
jgi:hypothetical protein